MNIFVILSYREQLSGYEPVKWGRTARMEAAEKVVIIEFERP